MIHDLRTTEYGEDVVNLGGLLANGIANAIDGAQAYIADPVVVDELQDVARFTGRPEFNLTPTCLAILGSVLDISLINCLRFGLSINSVIV